MDKLLIPLITPLFLSLLQDARDLQQVALAGKYLSRVLTPQEAKVLFNTLLMPWDVRSI